MLTWLELQWLVTGADSPRPRRRWLEAAADPGLGQESLQPGRAVIRHQRHTSILAIVLRHHRHISSSEEKMMRKELMCECLNELVLGGKHLCDVSSQSLWSSRVHILVFCYWLSDVTARLAAELTDSVSTGYTAAHLTVGLHSQN